MSCRAAVGRKILSTVGGRGYGPFGLAGEEEHCERSSSITDHPSHWKPIALLPEPPLSSFLVHGYHSLVLIFGQCAERAEQPTNNTSTS